MHHPNEPLKGNNEPKLLDRLISSFSFDSSLNSSYGLLLLTSVIALSQFLLHLGAMGSYGFHQDELLYITLGDHLSWGYRETPPFIALMSVIGEWLFGDSLIGVRLIPAFFAGGIVHLTGLIVIRLGGRYFAALIGCITVAFSSAFLATGALFIPQVFDEFFWLLCTYLVLCYLQGPKNYLLYLLGVAIGVGILVKYTLAVYLVGVVLGVLLNRESRRYFSSKTFLIPLFIAILILSPHMIWQVQNGFPAFLHLDELQHTQLVHVGRMDFVLQQIVSNGTGLFVWLGGLVYILFSKKLRPYLYFATGFMLVMLVLLVFRGKAYYAFGAFPPLFAVGGIFFEDILRRSGRAVKVSFVVYLLLPNLVLSLVVLPYLPIGYTSRVFKWTYDNWGLDFPLRWEDQKVHIVNQNYADMIGWEELAVKTSRFYKRMSTSDQRQTIILAEGYGAAAAFTYYARKHPLPKVVSLSSSFAMWAPEKITAKNLIFFSSEATPVMPSQGYTKFASIDNPYSRVFGRGIYFVSNVKKVTLNWYASEWSEKRLQNFDFRVE
ncbi:glycosyltransferase family 39 protein [Pedobacter frigidisoli]|uniref:Glycosyltransferase family 39 protein n=1 Tax=Pedobacter frigidisoli TaxID=2530455 RepID=A0A4R0P2F5_9SPHI|nr:glycosyltransferase family 39 protein [Pedobacter frigidisoli]TCD11005.1 glycosyltransferase family 39 protein [Pedobacter frigidisoli]